MLRLSAGVIVLMTVVGGCAAPDAPNAPNANPEASEGAATGFDFVLEGWRISGGEAVTLDFGWLKSDPPKLAVNVTFTNVGAAAEAPSIYRQSQAVLDTGPVSATTSYGTYPDGTGVPVEPKPRHPAGTTFTTTLTWSQEDPIPTQPFVVRIGTRTATLSPPISHFTLER